MLSVRTALLKHERLHPDEVFRGGYCDNKKMSAFAYTARYLTWNISWDAELSLFSFCSRLLIKLPQPSGVSGSFTTVFSGRLPLGNGDGLNQRRMPSKYLLGTKSTTFQVPPHGLS